MNRPQRWEDEASMTEPSVTLDEALAEAHLPALAAALVHLTGDASLVSRDGWPSYS